MGGASSKTESERGGGYDTETIEIVHLDRTPDIYPDKVSGNPDVMDTAQAGRYLHLHPKTVAKLARLGIIPAAQLQSQWRFSKIVLDRWLEGD